MPPVRLATRWPRRLSRLAAMAERRPLRHTVTINRSTGSSARRSSSWPRATCIACGACPHPGSRCPWAGQAMPRWWPARLNRASYCDHAARCRSAGSPTSTGLSSPIDALSSRTDRPTSTVIVRSASPARFCGAPLSVSDRSVACTERGQHSTAKPQPAFPICALFARTGCASNADRRAACLTDC